VYLRQPRPPTEAAHLHPEPEHAEAARRRAAEAMSAKAPSPVARSVTRRRKHITKAKAILARYAHLTTLRPSAEVTDSTLALARITELLRAQSEIERALWLETSGKMGDELSTPRRIVMRVVVATGDEEVRDVTGL